MTRVRIASLLASGTELVCELGAGDELVARSHECDTPEWVTRLPCASRPTFPIDGTSAEIDARVRAKLAAREPLYEVDEALLADLAPDVVITQTHCEVCAVTPGQIAKRKQVVALHTGTVAGILDGFHDVARVIGRDASALIDRLRGQLMAVERRVADRPRPRVAIVEWIEPVFHAANWMPELVAAAGGELVRDDPDVLIVAPCGFGLDRALADMPRLALRAPKIFVADGNRYFNRSSPSVFTTVEILAEILHDFTPVHASAWRRWP